MIIRSNKVILSGDTTPEEVEVLVQNATRPIVEKKLLQMRLQNRRNN
ncbi:MAG: hypothetical protein HDT32_03910 [Clostridiales bacterium]|nr:hypothetical protein [Clostridiales bacterium]